MSYVIDISLKQALNKFGVDTTRHPTPASINEIKSNISTIT